MKFITIVFILFTHFSFSQTVGFLGKKNVITINGVGSIPIIQNLFQGADSESPYYTYENGKLKSSKDFFNGGVVAGFSHAFSNKFGLGFERIFALDILVVLLFFFSFLTFKSLKSDRINLKSILNLIFDEFFKFLTNFSIFEEIFI